MRGTVSSVQPVLAKERLKVVARIKTGQGEECEAFMPDREVAAILPRSILLGSSCRAPRAMLETIRPILVRMTEGRTVRLWTYGEKQFFSFLPWKSVHFAEDP